MSVILRACQCLDITSSNSTITHEWEIENNFEGTGRGLFNVPTAICLDEMRKIIKKSQKNIIINML